MDVVADYNDSKDSSTLKDDVIKEPSHIMRKEINVIGQLFSYLTKKKKRQLIYMPFQ